MPLALSDSARKLVDGTNYAVLGTVNPDGSPQTSPVWLTRDGDDVLVSTTVGRQKEKNLARDSRASITVFDHDNPYQYVEIRGHVTLTEEGGFELRDSSNCATGWPRGTPARLTRGMARTWFV
jgi:PPOX class probable F420-dependent enzyme